MTRAASAPAFQVALADLDEVDAGVDGIPDLRDETGEHGIRPGAAGDQAPPVGDQADHRVSSCSDTSAESLGVKK